MDYLKLINGLMLPKIGLGTWQINDRELMKNIIRKAYENGYRLIDTAAAYSNEIAAGKAIQELDLPREELILSDKVWNTNRSYEGVQSACKTSLKKLKTDYLDIYLIHWPASLKLHDNWKEINADAWSGMEKLYKDGLVKAIGVCNFKSHHLEELKKTSRIMPMINQIEYHPGMTQKETVDYCKKNDIIIEASSPLGNGQILQNESLKKIAKDKDRNVAKICLRWAIQRNVIVLPKTGNIDRLFENIDVFNFDLSDEEMNCIDNIPYCGGIGLDPDEVIKFG